ncbi:DUF6094 domain-containing protein [Paenibacillus sp. FSL K6-3166]|uniref:DUF6094 domain-containing protein n=1 Tax=Paenibacillus sp. FSL K6-3166 TaxID=2921492 RepID=UPI001D785D2A|nr:SAM-dependent DNA methyltransferase [Acinetobacter sp. CUI P1]
MARLESEAKGGFYPTPPDEMEFILKRIIGEDGATLSIFDPCAGKGNVVKQIKQHLEKKDCVPITYGIEIEKTRAREAVNQVDHMLACGYEDARISHNAFSFLYLNPPFMEIHGERAEKRFFRDLTEPDGYLSVGSLVVLNIPQYVLADVARLIATRLEQVRVYRFTNKNYDDYHQVIVYGYRRASGQGRDEQLQEYLENLSKRSQASLNALDYPDWDEVSYMIPAQEKPVEIFTSTIVEPEDIIKSEVEIGFLDKVFAQVEDVRLQNGAMRQPAMPLKITHQVQAIQSGALPEHMGGHLLVAKDESVHTERLETDPDNGKQRLVETYVRKSVIRTFGPEGHLDLK